MGDSVTFNTTLNATLPTGYFVKLKTTSGFILMSGNGTNYSISQTPTSTGVQTFSIGIYDASNVLKGKDYTGSFEVIQAQVTNSAPTIKFSSGASIATTGMPYSVELTGNDKDNNLVYMSIDWGDNGQDSLSDFYDEFGIKDGTAKSFAHTYTTTGNFTITAYDYDSYQEYAVMTKSITVSKPAPVVIPPVVNTPTTTKTPVIKVASTSLTTPNLLTLADGVNLPLKKAAKFTWSKVTGATKYQIVFSTDNKFGNYDQTKNKCLNTTTCFAYVVNPTSYPMTASHNILKKDGSYFWIVQAISKKERSNSSDVRSFSVGTITPPTIETVSASAQEIALGESITLNVVLDRGLPANYSVKASIDNAEFQTMTGSGTSFSLKLSPTQAGEQYFQISLFDSNGIEIDSSGDIFTVTEKAISTTGYTKIANDGSVLSDNAVLGSKPKDWACTKDNKTGLIWEIKTDDGGLRDKDWSYSWYEPDVSKNGGDEGYTDHRSGYGVPNCSTKDNCNTYAFTNAVNKQGLCAVNDWRMPTYDELQGLVYCSDGKYNKLTEETLSQRGVVCASNINSLTTTSPTINTTYFPDIKGNYVFWSSSPYAWGIDFGYGGSHFYDKGSYGTYVRLVR